MHPFSIRTGRTIGSFGVLCTTHILQHVTTCLYDLEVQKEHVSLSERCFAVVHPRSDLLILDMDIHVYNLT